MLKASARALFLLWIAAGACIAAAETAGAQQRPPLVAAASDLRFALDEVVKTFRLETDIGVRVTYGSSGNLARQIEQGAPFELFLAADESFVLDLASKGLTRDEGTLYAIGRIVLFAPNGSSLAPAPELRELRGRIADGTLRRLSIANPEHAPYGRAAEQALRSLGVWEAAQPALVFGENIAQAAQFAASGNADGGIIAYSLALAPRFREQGTYTLIPDTLHAPLRQRMALTDHATAPAKALYAHLRSEPSREVLAAYGFTRPDD